VPSTAADLATNEIRTYEAENPVWTADWIPPHMLGSATPTAIAFLCLAVFYAISRSELLSIDMVRAGAANAGLILDGEIWRVVTALTLHADGVHLLSNLVVGAFFVTWLCRELGSGLGWTSVLASGVLGNAVNAFFQPPYHVSVGASTALFGAMGIIAGLRTLDHDLRGSRMKQLVPLGAGLALLGMLGSGGERTDLGAHLFGLVAGFGIGALLATVYSRIPLPGLKGQTVLGVVSASVVAVCWVLAI
jgi:membrane associated rhomboid family serine protease